jgi:hypothetical protein
MPKTSKAKLEYMAEYQKRPENVKKRVERNAARREALREGLVHKGDDKEVDHKKMLDEGGTNAKSNQRVIPAEKNRGWRKDHPGVYGKNKK